MKALSSSALWPTAGFPSFSGWLRACAYRKYYMDSMGYKEEKGKEEEEVWSLKEDNWWGLGAVGGQE